MLNFVSINYLAVLVAALAAYFFGALWYSPVLFGNTWIRALGKSKEELPAPRLTMFINFILTLVTALGLALLIKGLGVIKLFDGILIGLVIAIAFIVTNTLSEYLYSGASMKLFWIHAGYRVVYILIMGAILGVWR
jgi:hypothetical protein